jgi:hypothetical protein
MVAKTFDLQSEEWIEWQDHAVTTVTIKPTNTAQGSKQ